jgi:N-acetyl-gamma-glutamyl-phosphate reductase
VASHRHATEIKQQIKALGSSAEFSFVPHVNAMDHGIEAALYFYCDNVSEANSVEDIIRETCSKHDLFRYFETPPGVKSVVKTPFCDLSVVTDGSRAIVISNIDNLWKGAASQAIQNANLMFDRPMTEGLL